MPADFCDLKNHGKMICQYKSFFVNTNIYSRKGNRNFPRRTPVWQRFALREEGEFAPLL